MEFNFKKWLEQVSYRLMYSSTGNLHYALFTQNIYVVGSNYYPFPAAIGYTQEGKIQMIFNEQCIQQLPIEAGTELLKHEVLHLIFGHLASFRRNLTDKFGDEVVSIATDISVNQFIDCKLMEDVGMHPTTHEKFDLPRDKTTEWYCTELYRLMKNAPPPPKQNENSNPDEQFSSERGNLSSNKQLSPEQIKALHTEPWELILDNTVVPDDVIEKNLVNIIISVKNEAQSIKGNKPNRGFDSLSVKEFIESVKRKAVIPWYAILRRMEARGRREKKEPSLFKASRRGPTPPYLGRVRKSVLNVWFCVDTSGSMHKDDLKVIDSELKGISKRGAQILVVHADAKIVKKETYSLRKGLSHFYGRGGTDFSQPLIELFKLPFHLKPAFVVYYTDGDGGVELYREFLKQKGCDWNKTKGTKTPCGVEILWLLTSEKDESSVKKFQRMIPFGRYEKLPILGRRESVLDDHGG
jgi:predicted metal-dependent peptidase